MPNLYFNLNQLLFLKRALGLLWPGSKHCDQKNKLCLWNPHFPEMAIFSKKCDLDNWPWPWLCYERKGFIHRNIYEKYESSITYHSKAMANVKAFADKQTDRHPLEELVWSNCSLFNATSQFNFWTPLIPYPITTRWKECNSIRTKRTLTLTSNGRTDRQTNGRAKNYMPHAPPPSQSINVGA